MLTGRYKFEPRLTGVMLYVEEHSGGFYWRKAKKADLGALEPAVMDGWRFVEERHGILLQDGKRIPDR